MSATCPPTPEPLQARLTEGSSLLGALPQLALPLWQKTECIQSPSEGVCTRRLHALRVQPSPQSLSHPASPAPSQPCSSTGAVPA